MSIPFTNINSDENNYLSLLGKILIQGNVRKTRNATTISLFGEKLEFNLQDSFPLLTTKKLFLRGIFEELVWFLNGNTNSKLLEDNNVNIWKCNSTQEFIDNMGLPYKEGDIGNMYGFQLKHYGEEYKDCLTDYSNKGFDQIKYCINLLKHDKYSRRILMTTYRPDKAHHGVLYPCHGITIQFYVSEIDNINYLSCHMYQRSADMFLGVPFNIASYSLLVYMLCNILNSSNECDYKYKPDKLIMSFGDAHIYEQHYECIHEQMSRNPYIFPSINIKSDIADISDFKWEHIELENYKCYDRIKADMVP
jgi:thymidylate synthase